MTFTTVHLMLYIGSVTFLPIVIPLVTSTSFVSSCDLAVIVSFGFASALLEWCQPFGLELFQSFRWFVMIQLARFPCL